MLLLPLRLLPYLMHDPPEPAQEWDMSHATWQADRIYVKETYRLMERPTRLGCLLLSGALVGLGALIGYLVHP
jgi:hypothetical protein